MRRLPVCQVRLLRQLTTLTPSRNSDPEMWRALVAHHKYNGETTRQANDHAAHLLDHYMKRKMGFLWRKVEQ